MIIRTISYRSILKYIEGGFDNMNANEKDLIEKRILDELGEEIRNYAEQGKLYMFEKAMDNAMEKFKLELKERTEKELDNCTDEECKKKTVQNVDSR